MKNKAIELDLIHPANQLEVNKSQLRKFFIENKWTFEDMNGSDWLQKNFQGYFY